SPLPSFSCDLLRATALEPLNAESVPDKRQVEIVRQTGNALRGLVSSDAASDGQEPAKLFARSASLACQAFRLQALAVGVKGLLRGLVVAHGLLGIGAPCGVAGLALFGSEDAGSGRREMIGHAHLTPESRKGSPGSRCLRFQPDLACPDLCKKYDFL